MSINLGARTWELVRKQAKKIGADVQSLATSYAIERFMVRLMESDPTGRITVKGGQSLGILFGNQMRPTKDLDINVSIDGLDDPKAWAEDVIRQACASDFDDGVLIDIATIDVDFREHQGEGGLRITVNASIHTCRTPFMIDVGIGNEITFEPSKILVPGVLSEHKTAPKPLEARLYPHENTIAEKIISKVEDGIASIRHKDFFDIWLSVETLRRVGDLRLLVVKPEDLSEFEVPLVAEVKNKLSDGTLLEMPEIALSDDCLERLGLALHCTAAHRGTEIPEDIHVWLINEFAEDKLHSSQWANWSRNQKGRLLFLPPGTEKGSDKENALHVLFDNIGPVLNEIGSKALAYESSSLRL